MPDDAWSGKVKLVTDPNGVETFFDYDQWGQPHSEIENPNGPESATTPSDVITTADHDSGGRVTGTFSRMSANPRCLTGTMWVAVSNDANDNVTLINCGPLFTCIDNGLSCDPPGPAATFSAGCVDFAGYTDMGHLTQLDRCIYDPTTGESGQRNYETAHDGLYRVESQTTTSREAVWDTQGEDLVRDFQYNYDDAAGTTLVTGPDGETIYSTLDGAGRPATVTRSTPNGSITATYTYDSADRPELIEYGNATRTMTAYDDADRLTAIRHESDQSDRIHEMQYHYTADGLVDWIDEWDAAGNNSLVNFTYDNRNRLTDEYRSGQSPYDLSYMYDLGGNRLTKTDNITGWITSYVYDVMATDDDGQHNNRLLSYEVDDGEGIVEQAWYEYGASGNVMRFVRWEETQPNQARLYWFYYDTSDHLWMTVAATGSFDQEIGLGSLSNCVADKAAEYRYDSAIQRYLVRPRDPVTLDVLPGALWRDYDSENIYVDYAIDPATGDVTHGTAYQAGIGIDDPAASDMPGYFAGDQIGTTRAISGTNSAGAPVLREAVYTAFGEPVSSSGSFDTRYGYAGAWGYERAESFDPLAELGWLHVGHRYYDSANGRFVQRDPIGIRGGLNVYSYVKNRPSISTDADGLIPDGGHNPNVPGDGPFPFPKGSGSDLKKGVGDFIDKAGGQIERDRSSRRTAIRGAIAGAGARVPKGIRIPGKPGTTSIWTKAPCIRPWVGMWIGRVFLPITLIEGTFAVGDIGRGIMAWSYDEELDGEGIPFY